MKNLYAILFKCLLVMLIGVNQHACAQCNFTPLGSQVSAGTATWTSIAINQTGTPYIVYEDGANGNKATVMKYNGTAWVNVGASGFTPDIVQTPSIVIDANGTPYICYKDGSSSGKAIVMKYNGSIWASVGAASGFSAGSAGYLSMAFDNNNNPYVIYSDFINGQKATVMKYNGTAWINIGAVGFSAGTAIYNAIAIDPSGIPYVVFQDGANTTKATAMKYNGTTWVNAGAPGFSAGQVAYTTIVIDSNATPYVAYYDYANADKATVMKYNGTAWVNVGAAGFSAGAAANISMAIDGSGTPYVVYADAAASSKVTVMKYNGTAWVSVGLPDFSAAYAAVTSIAIDGSGTPYVGYYIATSGAFAQTLGAQLASTFTTQSAVITAPFSGLFVNSCNLIAKLGPSGTAPVSGSVTANVWLETTQPAQYVKRHYQITPATNATTATGTVTLYFTQAEFDAFNAVNTLQLPTGPTDAAGIANVRIEKRPGTSSDGSGLPQTYTGTAITIDPADNNIIWNSASGRWEISFAVTGFSGFFVKTNLYALPLQLLSFSVSRASNTNHLQWQTSNEIDTKEFVIERSTDGSSFNEIGTVADNGNGNYSFDDAGKQTGKVYYRLKMMDKDGAFTYSSIIDLYNQPGNGVLIYPTLFANSFTIVSTKAQTAILMDTQGKRLKTILLTSGSNYVDASALNKGIYILVTTDGGNQKIIKD